MASDMATESPAGRVRFEWMLAGLLLLGLFTFSALWAPLCLAAWCAHLARPLHCRVTRWIGGRNGSAAFLTLLAVSLVLGPLLVIAISMVGAALDTLSLLHTPENWNQALERLRSASVARSFGEADTLAFVSLLQSYGVRALGAATTMIGAATSAAIFILVFVVSFYSFLVERRSLRTWLLTYLPLDPRHTLRLGAAFLDTGDGLLIGFGLTALAQSAILTIAFVWIGVPLPFLLGLLVMVASFIPAVGTGLVWGPVAIGLFVAGRNDAAFWSLGAGCFVSVLDNVLRPLFSRSGSTSLPAALLLMAMLGGVAVFGPGGLLLGPVFVRLAIEALVIWRKEHEPSAAVALADGRCCPQANA